MRKAATASLSLLAAGVAAALGLAVAALASSGGSASPLATSETSTTEQPTTTKLASALSARAEVPKPTGVAANARGMFGVTLTSSGSSYSVKWTLTFSSLTGRATAAHIHRGKPGVAGPVLRALCGPCRSGQTGKAPVAKVVADAIKTGSTYVNVHTAKNKAGEIRGQIRKVG